MGYGAWSDAAYTSRSVDRAATAASTGTTVDDVTFAHTKAAAAGLAPALADRLNPKGMKFRESRDSKEHPNSVPVVVVLDETGSMCSVPRTVQQKLPNLMKLLVDKGYLEDPQILISAVGDASGHGEGGYGYLLEQAPLQVGQFESDLRIDDDITALYLEGKGGGTGEESYDLMAYVVARKTSTDAWEKRKKKGYVFFIADEMTYPYVKRSQIEALIGDKLEGDIPTKKLFEEMKERYNVFFILPVNTSGGRSDRVRRHWADLVGKDHVIALEDENGICELIGAQIGLVEGTVDVDTVADDLRDAGTDASTTAMVLRSVSKAYVGGGSISKVDPGAIKPSGGVDVERF